MKSVYPVFIPVLPHKKGLSNSGQTEEFFCPPAVPLHSFGVKKTLSATEFDSFKNSIYEFPFAFTEPRMSEYGSGESS